jgi:hypothetical protein
MPRISARRAAALVAALSVTGGMACWPDREPPNPSGPAEPAGPAVVQAAAGVNLEIQAWRTADVATEYKYALSTMNCVQSRLSSGRLARLRTIAPFLLPGSTEACLEVGAGICGNHVQAFEDVLAATGAGVRRRSVEFYLHDEGRARNRNHVAVEVYWANAWHFFDVTWGTYFLRPGARAPDDVLSAAELCALARAGRPWRELAVTNATNPWYRDSLAVGRDPFEYLAWPDTDLLSDGPGTIRLRPTAAGDGYSLQNLPAAIGHVREYCHNPRGVEVRLDPAALEPAARALVIEVGAVSNPGGDAALVVRAGSTVLHSAGLPQVRDTVVRVDLGETAEELTIRVESASNAGLARLRGVRRGPAD